MKGNKVSPFIFKWMMNFYPPFLFGRVRVKSVSADFKQVKVKINKSIFNKNLSGTLFGGTMFYALMYWQNFAHQYDMKVRVWLKSAEIKYKKPADEDMFLDFKITQEDIEEAMDSLQKRGKHNKEHHVELKNKKGEVCATVSLVTYVGMP